MIEATEATSDPQKPFDTDAAPQPASQGLRFIDLFAGLGGFHLALNKLDQGHKCVFASELDPQLQKLYKQNFTMDADLVRGDITKIKTADVPEHDILCAGFPCQPFSKAGEQNGLSDPRWGKLFYHLLKIVKIHQPRFLMLENVPNFARHDNRKTWLEVRRLLVKEGYDIRFEKLSPHEYGIPQIRERVFIVGKRGYGSLDGFVWPKKTHSTTDITDVLDKNPVGARKLSAQALACIDVWQDFLDRCPPDVALPSFPIWTMEFGATYPYEDTTPHAVEPAGLRGYLGAYGQPLAALDDEAIFKALPTYARDEQKHDMKEPETFPRWKMLFIKQNRDFYKQNKAWIDPWRSQLNPFPASLQKFEWNAKGKERDLSKLVLQFRASGLRAKRRTTAPSLIAMTMTQVPVITWEGRYMTTHECSRLQSMEDLTLPDVPTRAYAALGNAVNVHVVKRVAAALLSHEPALQLRFVEPDPGEAAIAAHAQHMRVPTSTGTVAAARG